MREYEVLTFIEENATWTDPYKEAVNLVTDLLKQEGATPLKVEALGRRVMGYRIRKHREAQLVVSHCRMEPKNVSKLTKSLGLNSGILTSMITQKKPEVHRANPLEARPVKKPFRGRMGEHRSYSEQKPPSDYRSTDHKSTDHKPRGSYASKPQ